MSADLSGFSLTDEAAEALEERTCNVLIVRGVEGLSVYLDDTRVAGNKPWGGGDIVAEWTVPRRYVLGALKVEEDA